MTDKNRFHKLAQHMDRGLLPFMGPAQLGAGHPEEPLADTTAAPCPLCGQPMSTHKIIRSANAGQATRLICP